MTLAKLTVFWNVRLCRLVTCVGCALINSLAIQRLFRTDVRVSWEDDYDWQVGNGAVTVCLKVPSWNLPESTDKKNKTLTQVSQSEGQDSNFIRTEYEPRMALLHQEIRKCYVLSYLITVVN
jgi:hypothetical protein